MRSPIVVDEENGEWDVMDSRRTVGAALEAMGRELDGLGLVAERIQDALSPALSYGLMADPNAVAALQELDRLTQTLRALAGVASRPSGTADGRWTLDLEAALAAVPLGDLARRLGAR